MDDEERMIDPSASVSISAKFIGQIEIWKPSVNKGQQSSRGEPRIAIVTRTNLARYPA